MSGYKVKGTNGDETTCACCGRDDLTRVVWLAPVDADGNERQAEPYGTTCAARLVAPRQTRTMASQLVNVSKAIAFVHKYAGLGYDLDDIRNAVGVKFNVWASVEGGVVKVNTPTGWVVVR